MVKSHLRFTLLKYVSHKYKVTNGCHRVILRTSTDKPSGRLLTNTQACRGFDEKFVAVPPQNAGNGAVREDASIAGLMGLGARGSPIPNPITNLNGGLYKPRQVIHSPTANLWKRLFRKIVTHSVSQCVLQEEANKQPKGQHMKKQYEVTLTASQVSLIQLALGGQVIKDARESQDLMAHESSDEKWERLDTLADRLETAQDLATLLVPIGEQIVAEYENSVVQEFVTNLDQAISDLLK
jgi:hypothetical protein